MLKSLFLVSIFLLLVSTTQAQQTKREFRAIWIATVNHIDWPSLPGISPEAQQKELISMLDKLEELNFNTVIFQVRPAGDAFYNSESEPWSAWLTGKQGQAPRPFWDPLTFLTNECHKRGMELHAWLNPFRIKNSKNEVLSSKSVAIRHPNWVVEYGNKWYLDPGIPEVRKYIEHVVNELVRKYDIDAIHFDDYFYPYPIRNTPFPDQANFIKYGRNYQAGEVEHWRRENVDLIIETLGKNIKRIKPWVKFGISPFGVWRNYDSENGGSVTKAGNTNYDNLYADVLKWQEKGWIDYLIPQLYWEIGHPAADFITLANWWNDRAYERHMYIGHALYKSIEGKSEAWNNEHELPEQIRISRQLPYIEGSAFFRMRYLEMNPLDIQGQLKSTLYTHKALQPAMEWKEKGTLPLAPKVKGKGFFMKNALRIKPEKNAPKPFAYAIYVSMDKEHVNIEDPANILLLTNETEIDISDFQQGKGKKTYLWVTCIDRFQRESLPSEPIKFKF